MSSSRSVGWRVQSEVARERMAREQAKLDAQRARVRELEARRRADLELERRKAEAAELERRARAAAVQQLKAQIDSTQTEIADLRSESAKFHLELHLPDSVTATGPDRTEQQLQEDLALHKTVLSKATEEFEAQLRRRATWRSLDSPQDDLRAAEPDQATSMPGSGILAAADELMERDWPRCATEDLDDLCRQYGALKDVKASAARIALSDFEVQIAQSVRRRNEQLERLAIQAELSSLIDAALPEEQADLRAALEREPDDGYSALRVRVDDSIKQASARRAIQIVTQKTIQALVECGFDVQDGPQDLLQADPSVLLFGLARDEEPSFKDDYRLRLRVDDEHQRMYLTLVRHEDAPVAHDYEVAVDTCETLEPITAKLQEDGITLSTTITSEPSHAKSLPTMSRQNWPSRQTRSTRSSGRPTIAVAAKALKKDSAS